MKKVFLKIYCKRQLRKLSSFINKDIESMTSSELLKLSTIIITLYDELDKLDGSSETTAYLLLEDWVYFFGHYLKTFRLHKNMTNEIKSKDFTRICNLYISELEDRLNNLNK